MKKILVTGGTTFVSKYAAEYFVNMGYEVYVLNRNTKSQVRGVKLIEGDRHNLNGILKNLSFDVVADITAYNEKDIIDFVKELGSYGQYIMISSSAVYPEYGVQPFLEESEKVANIFWGTYGTDKIAAEKALLERVMQDCGEDKISVEDLKLYVKPEDNACYYVANGNVAGKGDLY